MAVPGFRRAVSDVWKASAPDLIQINVSGEPWSSRYVRVSGEYAKVSKRTVEREPQGAYILARLCEEQTALDACHRRCRRCILIGNRAKFATHAHPGQPARQIALPAVKRGDEITAPASLPSESIANDPMGQPPVQPRSSCNRTRPSNHPAIAIQVSSVSNAGCCPSRTRSVWRAITARTRASLSAK